MAVNVSFSNGSKRENSTLQLTMNVTHSCTFKNGCNMLNPTLLLEINSATFPDYTAFKIEDRYYNVTDIRSIRNNLFEVSGEVDVLATYKANILNTTAYVIYDTVPNTELIDNRLPMKTTVSTSKSETACPLEPSTGKFILSLTGNHNSTGVYLVNATELRALIDDIQDIHDNIFDVINPPVYPSNPTVESVLTYWVEYFGWFFESMKLPIEQFFGSGNIPENIRECKLLPFDIGTAQFTVSPVYLGTFKTKQTLHQISAETQYFTASVSIPWQVGAGDFRRRSPFTDVYLYIPYIGMVKLSSENLENQSSVEVTYAIAIRNGDMVCTVFSGDRTQVIGQYPGNVAVEVPIGFSNINLPKAGQALIAGATAAVSDNLGGVGLAALNFANSVTPNFSCIGGLDGIASIATNQNITCYTVFHDTIAPPNTEIATIGAPTMKPKTLTGLTGFVQTKGASVAGAMTADERTKINRLLDSGIFIE